MAINSNIQKRLQNELDEICCKNEVFKIYIKFFFKTPTYEQLNSLKYADAVMKETLRFYPIAAL